MLLQRIQQLEKLSDPERFQAILEYLEELEIKPEIHSFYSGKNIIVNSTRANCIGVASHFDTVSNSPGANDNASAISVCIEIAKLAKEYPLKNIGVEIFFFDMEEIGMQGSTAYLEQYGTDELFSLINMEMVGMGNQFALWPLNNKSKGLALESFENIAKENNINYGRFDKLVMNNADHDSFRKYGIDDAFTISCISDKDVEVASSYYNTLNVDREKALEIMQTAPIFEHYHKPTDLSSHLSEKTLKMTVDSIWGAIIKMNDMAQERFTIIQKLKHDQKVNPKLRGITIESYKRYLSGLEKIVKHYRKENDTN